MSAPVLSVAGLRKSFGPAVVLRSVDLEVAAHRVAVLIGASGSGKSTLLRCVNLLETVDDGVVRQDGEDITDPRVDADRVRLLDGGTVVERGTQERIFAAPTEPATRRFLRRIVDTGRL